ncbi:hypothetical protein SLEP1_g14930 [Rubroshorea leprosula]|uniref:Uncharacterized protein n=1 Tax=Rubroshorea leprosula TaxID=152421 RepID=A0AAV5IKR5_9ROSI|nr:hypothetical protein SLEP1_g14930 [Rubroshorea leprosula]
MPRLSGRSGNVAVGEERSPLDLIGVGLTPVVPICQPLFRLVDLEESGGEGGVDVSLTLFFFGNGRGGRRRVIKPSPRL